MAGNRYAAIRRDGGDTETVHLAIRPVWRSYWKGFCLFGLAGLILWENGQGFEGMMGTLAWLGMVGIRRYRYLFTVTSQRVIMRIGLISRNLNEVEIRHTRELRIRQGVVERLMNYGNVEVSTAAGTGPEVIFRAINAPFELKEALRNIRNGF